MEFHNNKACGCSEYLRAKLTQQHRGRGLTVPRGLTYLVVERLAALREGVNPGFEFCQLLFPSQVPWTQAEERNRVFVNQYELVKWKGLSLNAPPPNVEQQGKALYNPPPSLPPSLRTYLPTHRQRL